MNFINLTPHTIRLCDADGRVLLAVEPSGTVARIAPPPAAQPIRMTGIPVPVRAHRSLSGRELVGLPPRQPGTAYIVSLPCLDTARLHERDDVYAPDSGPTAVRRDGQVWGVRALIAAIQVPSYSLLFGSAVHSRRDVSVSLHDIDVLYYGCDPESARGALSGLQRAPIDAHRMRPRLVTNHDDPAQRVWEVDLPVWGEDDPGHTCWLYRPGTEAGILRVNRRVHIGLAATVRRYVAIGTWELGYGYALEICRPDGHRAGYGGSGLLAVWRAVQHARRRGVTVPVWDAIGDYSEAQILGACELGDRATPTADLAAIHEDLAADAAGSPAAGNGATYTHCERGWRAPYRDQPESPWLSDSEMMARVDLWISAAQRADMVGGGQ